MQTQNDFLKNQARCISHEIRNQISISDVYCEIIRKHLQKNNVSIPSVDNALNCIQKSSQMINNSLLDLKALGNYEYKTLDLNSILLQGIELAKVYVHEKHIDILFEAEQNCIVSIDENKFLAALINLLKNAVEAIEIEGWIKIQTEVFSDFAKVKISNNGEKIPQNFIERLFDEGQTTKNYGSGLGLFISKNNLKLMGADLNLIKSDNDSTVFEITVPIKKS